MINPVRVLNNLDGSNVFDEVMGFCVSGFTARIGKTIFKQGAQMNSFG